MKTILFILTISSTYSVCTALSPIRPVPTSRQRFVKEICTLVPSILFTSTTAPLIIPPTASAIEFVPASPSFTNSYNDAIEILSSQRIACDNIIDVISDGNLNEAAFKVMQLNAQTKVGGKIILDSIQNNNMSYTSGSNSKSISSSGGNVTTNKAINTIKFLRCQEKFVLLLDLCSDCEIQIGLALKGKYGATAPAQLKMLQSVNNVRNAFDDFLIEFLEDTNNTTL